MPILSFLMVFVRIFMVSFSEDFSVLSISFVWYILKAGLVTHLLENVSFKGRVLFEGKKI